MHDNHKHGPTGPNGTWQDGDYYTNGFACAQVNADQAAEWNEHLAKQQELTAVGELSRLPYTPVRECPKCGTRLAAKAEYACEDARCSVEHGFTEHFDRTCRNCHYIWAENLP